MNKIIISIVLGVVFIALIIGVGVLASTGIDDSVEDKEMIFTEEVDSLEIKSLSSSIEIITTEDEDIKIDYYESSKVKFDISVKDNKLEIKEKTAFSLFNIRLGEQKVTVALPSREYDMKLDTSSGEIDVKIGEATNVDAKTSSGSISIDGLNVKHDIKADTSSGKITISNTIVEGILKATTSSGGILIEKSTLKGLVSGGSSSGSFKVLDSIMYSTDVDTSSGNIVLEISNDDAINLKASSSSGSVKIYLPETISGFMVNYKKSSGSYRCNFADNNPNYYKDGSTIIAVSTSSGSLSIQKKVD